MMLKSANTKKMVVSYSNNIPDRVMKLIMEKHSDKGVLVKKL